MGKLNEPAADVGATDCAAESDANIEWHHAASWRSPDDAYTPDESLAKPGYLVAVVSFSGPDTFGQTIAARALAYGLC